MDREKRDEASAGVGGRSGGRVQPGCAVLPVLSLPACPVPVEKMEKGKSGEAATLVWAQREVMSLRALSSSSLMALYFIFCA